MECSLQKLDLNDSFSNERFGKEKTTILYYIFIIVKVLMNFMIILITYKNWRFTIEHEEK